MTIEAMKMANKEWNYTILDDADAVARFLSEKKLEPTQVQVVLGGFDKFYVFYLS